MTVDPPKIDYETLAQDAMRGLVRTVLEQAAKSGLPGDHHFYISFDTCANGVSISRRLKEKYPTEMTIVLQHRFWDLAVHEDRFEVKLTFDGIPERLIVPFAAIKVFFDPSVRYGLQFEDPAAIAANSDPDIEPFGESAADALPLRPGHAPSAMQTIDDRADEATPTSPSDLEETLEETAPAAPDDGNGSAEDEQDSAAVIDAEQVASATEGAKILRLDAFRKK